MDNLCKANHCDVQVIVQLQQSVSLLGIVHADYICHHVCRDRLKSVLL